MKYNILTVANEDYKHFIKLFINSLFENCDMENIENVYVFDTGLSQETVDYLGDFPKVVVRQTDIDAKSDQIHDEGWKTNTYSKTKFLLSILQQDRIPTFMIDSDCIFVENFEDLIDWESDFVVCKRNRKGFSKYIGSFFGAIHISAACTFIAEWIFNIDFLQKNTKMKHCESPALVKTCEAPGYKIQELEEQVISAVWPTEKSRIYHLKSDHYALTVEQRINLPHARPFNRRYL